VRIPILGLEGTNRGDKITYDPEVFGNSLDFGLVKGTG